MHSCIVSLVNFKTKSPLGNITLPTGLSVIFLYLFVSFFLLWQRQDDHTRYNSDKSCQIHSRKSHMHKEYRHHRCCQRLNRCKQTCLGTSDQTNPFHITAKGHYRTKYDHDCNAADTLPVQKDISRHRPWLHKWCQTDSTDQHSPADHGKGSIDIHHITRYEIIKYRCDCRSKP